MPNITLSNATVLNKNKNCCTCQTVHIITLVIECAEVGAQMYYSVYARGLAGLDIF